jgi:hypothetical protein
MPATVPSTDDRGYSYVEASDSWKQDCAGLACAHVIRWPGYDTKVIRDTIDGKPVVIQLWKGRCQKFLGLSGAPGGIGAEVGVYRAVPDKRHDRDSWLPFFRDLANAFDNVRTDELWWPYPELHATLTFTLTNPLTNQVFFEGRCEDAYWLCKWMNPDSYEKYKTDQNGKAPDAPETLWMTCTVNDKKYTWLD